MGILFYKYASSYEIHLKQCKQLWVARENTKPPSERKPLPQDPLITLGAGGVSASLQADSGRPLTASSKAAPGLGLSLDEINRLAGDAFNNGGRYANAMLSTNLKM